MKISSHIIMMILIGVFSRGQDFEVPPSSFFDRFSSKALTEYFDNSLPKSAGGNNNAIQLSSLPNLSREDIIPSKNLFAKEITARRTTTSDESLTLQHPYTTQGIMKPEVHTSTAVVQSSTLNSTPNIPTSTTITEILHTSTIQITKSTSMSTETAGTTPVEHLISSTISANIESPKSSTTTEKPRNSRIKIDLTSRKGMKKECDKKKNYFFETSSHLPQKFKDNSTTTESTTRYHVSTSTTVFPIFPTTLKRRIFHTPSLRIIPHRKIPEVISRVSTSSPKFSFAFNVKQTPISNLMKNSELPLVAIGKKFYHVQTEIKANFLGAFHFCKKHKMDLLSIESKEEEEAIANFLNDSKISEVWTSGTDLAEEGKFVWLSVGKTFDYTNWGPNQPDDEGSIEDCVQIILRPLFSDYFSWEDVFCDLPSSFICEVSTCTDFCMNN